jgi:hypothetical protein
MAGNTLTTASSLACPHGARVRITPTNPRASAGGAPIVTADDLFTIENCPFQLPTTPPTPSPCIIVQWRVTDLKTSRTLSHSSVGDCISALQAPQGNVVIQSTQPKVATT